MIVIVAVALIAGVCATAIAVALRSGTSAKPVAVSESQPAGTRPPANAVESLILALRRRKELRIGLSILSMGLLIGAGAMIGYPFYTNLYQDRVQSDLDRQFASDELRQAYVERRVAEGDSLTRIIIPRLNVDVVVVEGTTASALRAGAGHYPTSPLPCEIGNVAIAGHRTTYGRPFHDLNLMAPGDTVILETPVGRCTYQVEAVPFIVAPEDVSVVANTPNAARLTLTTCHPKGSAKERLILQATMVQSETFDA